MGDDNVTGVLFLMCSDQVVGIRVSLIDKLTKTVETTTHTNRKGGGEDGGEGGKVETPLDC